jgi:tetratricopeptide (TPR) repeat protein
MASLIPGFEYDIFISYRQKDNKGDRWVSEFVEALKIELESTFKEEIGVYFDVNPHDGLLETYIVDASLREKLKSLIFIPIISQTYCDSKSFAWKSEFCSFNQSSKSDKFGRDIRLPGGNVASRILPVKIHELDPEDKSLIENELGGVLRSIDFIYRSSGVNRPLRAVEEHPQDNLNKTYYRDQINKVAHAIKELITILKRLDQHVEYTDSKKIIRLPEKPAKNKLRIILSSAIALPLLLLLFLVITHRNDASVPPEPRIAVLPFDKWFSNKDYSYLGDAIASQISSQLGNIEVLQVISFNSTRRYVTPNLPPIKQIGKECGANMIVQGTVELLNNNRNISIGIQLISINKNNPVYDEKFTGPLDSLQSLRTEIILKIAQVLHAGLSDDAIRRIQKGLTRSSLAYKNFLTGNYLNDASSLALMGKQYHDSISYISAIRMYDKAILSDSLFALAYARRAISRSYALYTHDLTGTENIELCKKDAAKALMLDPDLSEGHSAFGFYYYYCLNDYRKALDHFKKASELDPGNWQPLFYQAIVYRRICDWKKSQALLSKVLRYNPQDALILTNIGMSYCYLRNYDSALIFQDMAIRVMPNWVGPYMNKITTLFLRDGATIDAKSVVDEAIKQTGDRCQVQKIQIDIYDKNYKDALIKTELSGPYDFISSGEKLLQYAEIHNYLGHPDLARVYYDSALVFYERRLKEEPRVVANYTQIAFVYAGLSDRSKAIESGKKAVKLSEDPLLKQDAMENLARIYMICGAYDEGFKLTEELLKIPSLFSLKLLIMDPAWESVKNLPEFKKLSQINS